MRVKINGKEQDAAKLDANIKSPAGYSKSSRYANAYAEIFHTDYGIIEIRNEEAPDGTLLIIGDSYTNNCERLFAENYRTVYVIDPRKYEASVVCVTRG